MPTPVLKSESASVVHMIMQMCLKPWGYIFVIVGAAVAGFLLGGLGRVELLVDVTELWVEEGTRLQAEKAEFNSKFGGLPREGVVTVTAKDGSHVANSGTHLDALLSASKKILDLDASDILQMTAESPDGRVHQLTEADFCSRPDVPLLFRPTDFSQLIKTNIYSWSYAEYSICLSEKGMLIDPKTNSPVEPLPTTWGIDEFPCFRTSALDCFAEGGFDYPPSLQQLEKVSPAVLAAKEGWITEESVAAFKECEDAHAFLIFQAIQSFAGQEKAEELSSQTQETLAEFVVPLLFTWGYHWRPNYAGKSSDEIGELLGQAVRNSRDESISAEQCAREGLPCCLLWNAVPVDVESFMGDFTSGDTGQITAVGALRTEELNSLGYATAEERLGLVNDWEQEIIDLFLPKYEREEGSQFADGEEFSSTKFDFFVSRSSTDVVEEGNQVPWALLGGAYAIMITYTILTFFDWRWPWSASNFVFSRVLISLLGIGVISLATASGFGVMGWAGIKLSPISTNLTPFLALGVGLDDMFVILNSLISPEIIGRNPTAEEMMYRALSLAGPSVILTSASILVAFLVSSLVQIQAIYVFCYQAAATVAFNLIFLFLIFIPFCALDTKRFLSRRIECLPCLEGSASQGASGADSNVGNSGTAIVEMVTLSAKLTIVAEKFLATKVLLYSRWKKDIVIGVFLSFFGAMLGCGIALSESGLPLRDVALENSYQHSYVDLQERYFTTYGSYLVNSEETLSFEKIATQEAMLNQQLSVQEADHVSSSPAIRDSSFFANSSFSLLAYYNGRQSPSLELNTPIPEDKYYGTLAQWAVTAGLSFSGDIWCYNTTFQEPFGERTRVRCEADEFSPLASIGDALTTVKLASTRQSFVHRGLLKTQDFVDAIESSRERCDDLNVDGNNAFVYGYIYEFWEQYLHIWANFYKVVGLAVLGVAVVGLLFLWSLRITAISIAITLLVVVDLFGLMTLLGVKVNAVSITNYAVAVGLSVEFIAHYAHAFLTCRDDGRDDRARHALRIMFAPSTNGYLTTVLALLVVVANEFPFIRLYYFGMLFSMVSLAYLHGMILLPVIVSLIGPMPSADKAADMDEDVDGENRADEEIAIESSDSSNGGKHVTETETSADVSQTRANGEKELTNADES